MIQSTGKKIPKKNIHPCPFLSVISPSVKATTKYKMPAPIPIPHHMIAPCLDEPHLDCVVRSKRRIIRCGRRGKGVIAQGWLVVRRAGEIRSVHVPDPIGIQKRESGVLIETTRHPLESGRMTQAGFDASRVQALVWRGEE
jgi:hypothetical protein